MLIKVRNSWEVSESDVTPEPLFKSRRQFLKTGAAALAGGLAGGMLSTQALGRGDQLQQLL